MYNIIERKSFREEEGFRIEITIQPDQDVLHVHCLYPAHRRMSFNLHSKGSEGLIARRYYPGGSALHIPLAPYNTDSFELKASDEAGKTVVVYKLMRAFC